MKYTKMIVGVFCAVLVGVSALAATPVVVSTNVVPTSWAVTLGGVGLTGEKQFGQNWQWGGELGISKDINVNVGQTFVTDVGVRQAFTYGTVDETVSKKGVTTKENGWAYRTEVFWDWNVPISSKLTFFAGPDVSVNYGDVDSNWAIGPEAGLKYAFTDKWFVFGRVNQDFSVSGGPNDLRATGGTGFRF